MDMIFHQNESVLRVQLTACAGGLQTWNPSLESKWLAVFCSLRRLLLGTLLLEISFNWRIIGDFDIT